MYWKLHKIFYSSSRMHHIRLWDYTVLHLVNTMENCRRIVSFKLQLISANVFFKNYKEYRVMCHCCQKCRQLLILSYKQWENIYNRSYWENIYNRSYWENRYNRSNIYPTKHKQEAEISTLPCGLFDDKDSTKNAIYQLSLRDKRETIKWQLQQQ